MDLLAFSRMLLRRGWLPLVLGAIGVAAGLAFAAVQSARYEALTRISVTPARQVDLGQAQAAKEIMRSFTEDVHTHDMAEAAAAQLGDAWMERHDLTAEDLYWMVSVGRDENVYDIHVKARADDPAVATDVSEKWALAFVDRRERASREIELRERIRVAIRDVTTWQQVAPRRKLLAGLGGVLGVGLGGLLMLVLEYVERAVIRNERDARHVVGAAVLGTVPTAAGSAVGTLGALRHGTSDLLGALRRAARVGWPVLFMAVLGAATAFAITRAMPVVHRARTRIAVEPARASDWGQTQAIPQTITSFVEDITTRRMAADINAELQLDLPPERLLEKITVAPQPAVYEIHLDAHDPDPATAVAISRTWAEAFIRQHRQGAQLLEQRDRILVRLRDQTRPDPRPYSPRTTAAVSAGSVIGALLGAAAMYLLTLVRHHVIWEPADARAAAGGSIPILGRIPSDHRPTPSRLRPRSGRSHP